MTWFILFVGVVVVCFVAALVLVWVFVCLAALAYALSKGDGDAATAYAIFTAAGVLVGGLLAWAGRRVAGAARQRD